MKRIAIRDFRAKLAELIEEDEPLIVTRHGRPIAVVYPLKNVRNVPAEVRRDVVDSVARDYSVDDDYVIERYKHDVDRTLIRENLRRTPEERLRALEALQQLHDELRTAAHHAR